MPSLTVLIGEARQALFPALSAVIVYLCAHPDILKREQWKLEISKKGDSIIYTPSWQESTKI